MAGATFIKLGDQESKTLTEHGFVAMEIQLPSPPTKQKFSTILEFTRGTMRGPNVAVISVKESTRLKNTYILLLKEEK